MHILSDNCYTVATSKVLRETFQQNDCKNIKNFIIYYKMNGKKFARTFKRA